ncbi:MAG: lysozyme [Rhizomicrobium sp.]
MATRKMVGLSAAATLAAALIVSFEGLALRGYRDPAGIATKCFGDTSNVVVGQRYSEAECLASLKYQLAAHGDGVLACAPTLAGHPAQLAASVSFAYNIGVGAFCKSSVARRFNAGDFKAACRAINQDDHGHPQWISAGGRILPGLVKRRAAERALCEKDL